MPYNEYMKAHEGMFVMQYQCMYHNFYIQVQKSKLNLKSELKSTPNFNSLQKEYFREYKYSKLKTICVDIINTIIVKEDIDGLQELLMDPTFGMKYILVENENQIADCCENVG